jgi:hypothetical protein
MKAVAGLALIATLSLLACTNEGGPTGDPASDGSLAGKWESTGSIEGFPPRPRRFLQ